jgi:glc operon protein GlcG
MTTTAMPAYGPPISLELAKRVLAAAEAEAVAQGWPMVIAVVDSGGHLVALHRLDQAQLGSLAIARMKAETAVRFRRPTRVFEDAVAAGGQGLRLLSVADVCALEGGVPLVRDGVVIGGIGVSGMQSTQDAQVAAAGARAIGAAA